MRTGPPSEEDGVVRMVMAGPEVQVAAEEERPAVRPQRGPGEPTAAEREEHAASHVPYRAWCRSCVAGRGRSRAHLAVDHREDALATVAID